MSTTISAGTATSGAALSSDTSGILQLQSGSTPTTAVTIDTSQNVGIGITTNSGRLLQVNQPSGYTSAIRVLTAGSGAYYEAFSGVSNWKFGCPDSTDALVFTDSGTERARIDSSGNLLVGATTTIDQSRLLVQLNSTSTAFSTNGFSGDVTYCPVRIIKYDNNSTTSNAFIRFIINNDGTGSGQINANGSNQAAFGSYSDITLKENIVPLEPQLANINKIEVIEFDYLASEGGGHQIGFSAQNMQGIYPDSVGERLDGKLTLTGWNKTEARLVKAIQELSAKVTALEAKVGV